MYEGRTQTNQTNYNLIFNLRHSYPHVHLTSNALYESGNDVILDDHVHTGDYDEFDAPMPAASSDAFKARMPLVVMSNVLYEDSRDDDNAETSNDFDFQVENDEDGALALDEPHNYDNLAEFPTMVANHNESQPDDDDHLSSQEGDCVPSSTTLATPHYELATPGKYSRWEADADQNNDESAL